MGLSVSLSRIEAPSLKEQYADEWEMMEDNVFLLNDFEEPKTLYEFLDPAMHELIFEHSLTVSDNDALSRQMGEEVYVSGLAEEDGFWLLSNGTTIKEEDIPTHTITCNAIVTKELLYFGGSSRFDPAIFDEYNAREAYPSWFSLDEIKRFYKDMPHVQDRVDEIMAMNAEHPERLFIDLGY